MGSTGSGGSGAADAATSAEVLASEPGTRGELVAGSTGSMLGGAPPAAFGIPVKPPGTRTEAIGGSNAEIDGLSAPQALAGFGTRDTPGTHGSDSGPGAGPAPGCGQDPEPARFETAAEERAAIQAGAPDWEQFDRSLRAELKRPPAWANPAAWPPLGARCNCCRGQRWWREAVEPKGWRCTTCYPPDHLAPGEIVCDTTTLAGEIAGITATLRYGAEAVPHACRVALNAGDEPFHPGAQTGGRRKAGRARMRKRRSYGGNWVTAV